MLNIFFKRNLSNDWPSVIKSVNFIYISFQYLCTQPPPIGLQVDEEHQPQIRLDDDLIPFSDTPQISRFGPISRRMCPQTIPTQSQAVIGDETKPTSVVRHTKHMSRPVPAAASLLHQNGISKNFQTYMTVSFILRDSRTSYLLYILDETKPQWDTN